MAKNRTIFHIIFVAILLVSLSPASSASDPYTATSVYLSWEAIFDECPDTVIYSPRLEDHSPFDIEVLPTSKYDNATKRLLEKKALACAVGDSLWLINSKAIKRDFKGDCGKFDHYVPLYFSAKVAFVEYQKYGPSFGGIVLNIFLDGILGLNSDIGLDDNSDEIPDFYLLNFATHRVEKIDYKLMKLLLAPYPDLLRRYEQMHDYKEKYMVRDFFLQYVDRLNEDESVPYLF